MRPDAHTLLAAYAVDALDQEERADVREHVQECEACREDLRSFRETAAVLAVAEAQAPPARMRAAVLARARTTPQLPPLASEGAPAATAGGTRETDPTDPTDPTHPTGATGATGPDGPVRTVGAAGTWAPSRARAGRALFGLAASVVTVGALGAGAFGVVQSDRLGDLRAEQAAVQRVLSADDVVTVSAVPQLADGVQGDEVVVLASASQDAALLLPAGLPVAPEGSTWQAWTVTGDRAESAGTFDVASGEAVALQASVAGADAVAVSLEPAGGSESPSTDPVLVVPLA